MFSGTFCVSNSLAWFPGRQARQQAAGRHLLQQCTGEFKAAQAALQVPVTHFYNDSFKNAFAGTGGGRGLGCQLGHIPIVALKSPEICLGSFWSFLVLFGTVWGG